MNLEAAAENTALGVLTVDGADAADFLRAQLTNDVMRMGPDRFLLTAWCDAKGRTQFVARIVEQDTGYLLLMPRDIIPAVIQRLKMFVLRSAVGLEDASDRYALSAAFEGGPAPGRCERDDDGRITLGLSRPDERPRTLSLHTIDQAAAGIETSDSAWELGEIDAGIPSVTAPLQGEFVPQMLNLHWLAGIDFDKGCYPGQEVIARLHYRGRLTRRLFRLGFDAGRPQPGQAIMDATETRIGTVVRSARDGDAGGRLLAVLAVDHGGSDLRCGDSRLQPLELPYATPA